MSFFEEIIAPEAVGCHEEDTKFPRDLVIKALDPPEEASDTVISASDFDRTIQKAYYLWEEGNMPCCTSEEAIAQSEYDSPSFRPYVTVIPVPEDVPLRGAIVTTSGGGWRLRANYTESIPAAEELAKLGYLCFNVDYRIEPYTIQESAADIARAIRFARWVAIQCSIPSESVYVLGFSAGGFSAAEALSYYARELSVTKLDLSYKPDILDAFSASVKGAGLIYSHYTCGKEPATDVEDLLSRDLPPTFYSYGEADFLRERTEKQIDAMIAAPLPCARLLLPDSPHGYGALGGWIPAFTRWMEGL